MERRGANLILVLLLSRLGIREFRRYDFYLNLPIP